MVKPEISNYRAYFGLFIFDRKYILYKIEKCLISPSEIRFGFTISPK